MTACAFCLTSSSIMYLYKIALFFLKFGAKNCLYITFFQIWRRFQTVLIHTHAEHGRAGTTSAWRTVSCGEVRAHPSPSPTGMDLTLMMPQQQRN